MFKTIAKIHTHIRCVQDAIDKVAKELMQRGLNHDASKWEKEELEYYSAYEKLPQGLEFGSDEYRKALEKLNIGVGTPGFGLHSSRNDHHPEYYNHPSEMPLFAVIEMVCDWKGAHDAYENSGSWSDSVTYNIRRFDFSDEQIWVIEQVAEFLDK